MRYLLLFLLGLATTLSNGQTVYFGDQVFANNTSRDTLYLNSTDALVQIGHLFTSNKKEGLILQLIDKENYSWQLKTSYFHNNTITESIIDTLSFGMPPHLVLKDVNGDSYKDIIITSGFIKESIDIYTFDPALHSLTKVKSASKYPSLQKLDSSDYWYSYQAIGCTDNTWISYLISFEQNTITEHGKIIGDGCNNSSTLNTIISFNGEEHYQNYNTSNFPDSKWEFIEATWKSMVGNP